MEFLEYQFECLYMENVCEEGSTLSHQEEEWTNYASESPILRMYRQMFKPFENIITNMLQDCYSI